MKTISIYAQDMVELNEDLNSLASMCEQSLMWRSKPSQSTTWLKRRKQNKWIQHLFSLMLKPSHSESFIEKYTASLEVIPVNRSVVPVREPEQLTLDTFGLSSEQESNSASQTGVYSRMLKDISLKGSYKSSLIWKKWAMELRSDYSQRKKLARHTEGNESLSWPTIKARDWKGSCHTENYHQKDLNYMVEKHGQLDQDSSSTTGNRQECANDYKKVRMIPTRKGDQLRPETSQEYWTRIDEYEEKHGFWPTASVCGNHNRKGASENSGDGLSTAAKNWTTPCAADTGDRKKKYSQGGSALSYQAKGRLNPDWVCTLMGVPVGWVTPDEESSNRIDELRMLGNGVVPQTAAKAFITLIERTVTNEKSMFFTQRKNG